MANRGLGKGFDALFTTEVVDLDFDPTAPEDAATSQLVEIEISAITRDESQPRQKFDEQALQALADSIREHGVLQPIVVTREGSGYQLVAGERRWRAAKLASLNTIPAIIRTLDAQNRLEISIIENAQRENLNAIELATAYAKLKSQFNLSNKQIAERVGKGETSVINTLRLLGLPEFAKKQMLEHNLSEGVMRPLVTAPPEMVEKILPQIIKGNWSARQVERYIAAHKKVSSMRAVKTHLYAKQEEALIKKYHSKVRIGSTSVTFSCKDEQELQTLLEKLGK